jgi:glyceraldehyde-3-phosphate dehydrogenase/erythrose-4-phosphate dehydrogenase
LKVEVTAEEVNKALKAAAEGRMKGVLGYTEEPLVSRDIIGDPHSAIIDGEFSLVVGGKSKLVKIFSWYDNEWGYSSRLVDLMNYMCSKET